MGLGNRQANARHDTEVIRRQAVNPELWHDFRPEQRVTTVDGIPGKVIAVNDGFAPGAEEYIVELDNGLGGGRYTAGQLAALGPVTSEVHTAAEDYPELGTILHDRPDIAKGAARHTANDGACSTCAHPGDGTDYLGSRGCAECGNTIPYRVSAQGGHIHVDGEPVDHGWGPDAHSAIIPSRGEYLGMVSNIKPKQLSFKGRGATPQEAAESAIKSWAEGVGKTWTDLPDEVHEKATRRRQEEGYE